MKRAKHDNDGLLQVGNKVEIYCMYCFANKELPELGMY